MNRLEPATKQLTWFAALLLAALAAGCGGGGGSSGGSTDGTIPGAPAGAILPGAVCTAAAGATIPTVTASDPTSGNQFVTTSTAGVAGSGKLIKATFSLPMNTATITATTFTLTPVGGTALVPASVAYTAATRVATLTTAAALSPNTSYTAIVAVGAASAAGTPLSCVYAWNFKTAAAATTGLAPIDMGLAAPFGISATAGLTVPGGISTVNGNVLLMAPSPTCGGTAAPNDGIVVACPPFVPIINGVTISPNYDPGGTLATIAVDLNAAFLSLTPPAGPPAAGSLGGGTTIAAPTTLGGLAGGVYVAGTNYFVPGVYTDTGSSIMVTGDLTLDAQGDADAVFVFQSHSTVGTAAGAASPAPHTRILLINGAKASNIWWLAATSATIGLFSEFQGNILATTSITLNQGATSCGRMMAGAWVGGGGAITLDRAVASVPGNVSASASCK